MKAIRFPQIIFAVLLSAGALQLSSCSKDTIGGTSDDVHVGGNTDLKFADGDGCLSLLSAQFTYNTGSGTVTQTITTGLAYFPSSTGVWTNYVNVGDISMNGNTLHPDADNVYTFQTTDEIDFSAGVTWTVEGGSGVTGFTHTYNDVPASYSINAPDSASLSSEITLSAPGLSGADSVHYTLNAQNQYIWTMRPGNWTFFTFTPSQLSNLIAGDGVALITAFRFSSATLGGKKIYFVNERSVGKYLTLTN